jgi:glycerol-3-phosphate dehydrogenase
MRDSAASAPFDLLVIGGGINGVGIARDAAGRGLSMLLCEQDDLAAHTSSASTKLIHGGLRYLEYFKFNLVRKALREREALLRAAPHIISPLRFVMPHDARLRPAWLLRAGLFLYDHLGGRGLLPASANVDLVSSELGVPLRSQFTRGFVYSDAAVDDARLVVLNALDAAERGATILPRTRFISARRHSGHWEATLQASDAGATRVVRARAMVNAAGPWAITLMHSALGVTPQHNLLMGKGSHIVVRRLFDHDHAYILQMPDRRVIFAIPFERDFTLVGTTDIPFQGDPSHVRISAEETAYLCEAVNRYFRREISPSDVVWSYAGVRPLLDDQAADISAVTRDYAIEYDDRGGLAPLLSVLGGKITTYRRLAEEALALLAPRLGSAREGWTEHARLPGGDIADADFDRFASDLRGHYRWLPRDLLHRYAHAYGSRIHRLLGGASALHGLGQELGDGLFEVEVDYLVKHEWAQSTEDILWRRSKLGLRAAPATVQRLDAALPAFLRQQQKQDMRELSSGK